MYFEKKLIHYKIIWFTKRIVLQTVFLDCFKNKFTTRRCWKPKIQNYFSTKFFYNFLQKCNHHLSHLWDIPNHKDILRWKDFFRIHFYRGFDTLHHRSSMLSCSFHSREDRLKVPKKIINKFLEILHWLTNVVGAFRQLHAFFIFISSVSFNAITAWNTNSGAQRWCMGIFTFFWAVCITRIKNFIFTTC